MRRSLWAVPALAAVVCVLAAPHPARAAWPADGVVVCAADREQAFPKLVSDGAGGMIVAWTDDRDESADIYAQRLDGSGHPVWLDDGIPIRASNSYEFELVAMVTDGSDGAILVWTVDGEDIYAQHVDGEGNLFWGGAGTSCPVTDLTTQHVAVADGAGGVIVAWVEPRGSAWDNVIIQRFDATGTEVWAHGGIYVFDPGSGYAESDPCIDADGSGGAVVATVSGTDILAQRIFASGDDWVTGGIAVTPSHPLSPANPAIAHDGSGGAYVTWDDGLTDDRDVFINWVDGGGTKQWGDGNAVCTATAEQINADIVHVGAGNTVVCWEDGRNGWFDLYAQKVDGFGNGLWTLDGMNVTFDSHDQFEPRLLSSGMPELVVAFIDTRGGEGVAAQKIDAGGGTMWVDADVDVLMGDLTPRGWDVASDRAGGLIAAVPYNENIYAQAINARGGIYKGEPTIKGIADVPDDQGGWVRITIGYSDRDTVGVLQEPCARYDVWREIDASAAPAARAKAPARGGVSFYDRDGVRYLHAAPGAVVPAGTWELVGSFAAAQDTEYVYLTPTPADSSDAGTPYTTYFASAHTTNPAVWFASEVDSGYSVDNIPPHVPTSFAVAYNTGSGNQLTWDACPDDDFKYFRIYRSETPGFTPSPGDYVHGTTDSDWLDTVSEGWKYYYKITAVDMNDNESEPTGGTATAAEGPAIPDRLALYQNVPNPFNPSTTISMGLPAAGRVRLVVYGIDGGLVRTLVDSAVPAGFRSFTWDGTDDAGNRVSSGVYFYRLEAEGESITKKMVLLK
jgi:hypothetical protein